MSSGVDLSKIPAPDVVETLDYEVVLQSLKDDLATRDAAFSALDFESEPVTKLLEVVAYREITIRQRVNDAARAVMLAFAGGADLDQIAANIAVERQVLVPADPDAIPPIEAVYESDDDLRFRVQLAPEALSVAGSEGAYKFHTFSAGETATSVAIAADTAGELTITYSFNPDSFAALVKDASVVSPAPGQVVVTVLSRDGDGIPSVALLDQVTAHVTGDYVRPLTDDVTVAPAVLDNYEIEATLELYDGPDAGLVLAASLVSAQAYADLHHRLDDGATLSGITSALSVAGVRKVTLVKPAADLAADPAKAAYCTKFTIS